jgi:UDP-N-acetylmuramoyl-tripeptide--D-alanyl-D-alanine ligase
MVRQIKRLLFFPVASYFRFFGAIRLRRWHPQIVLITGSSGKTTLLHLVEAQLGTRARYTHFANSAFGIPFDILGLPRRKGYLYEWFTYAIAAPFMSFAKPPIEQIYIVEADSDRPGEAAFVSSLLRPDIVIWLSSDKSHSAAFDKLVGSGQFQTVEEAIAYEFGTYLASASKFAILSDSKQIAAQSKRTKAQFQQVGTGDITGYRLSESSTLVKFQGREYTIPALIPPAAAVSVAAAIKLCEHLGLEPDMKFTKFALPPGRSSVFAGVKGTTVIDSTYNAIPDAVRELLDMFKQYPKKPKWLILGDMIEQGKSESEEHARLAEYILALQPDRVVLVGPRVKQFTAPALETAGHKFALAVFEEPRPALDYLEEQLQGGEILMFKGARFLEGIVERLLADPSDASLLCRRGPVWERRRERWGL